MDDIQIVLYIIFVVFAILSKLLKKKKEVPQKKARNTSNQETEILTEKAKERPLTFDELLKEFTEQKTEIKEEEYFEEREIDKNEDEESKRIYEESIKASKRYEKEVNQQDDRHTGNFRHFEGYSEEDADEEENEYASLFQDPESAKRAIIASEILNRKY